MDNSLYPDWIILWIHYTNIFVGELLRNRIKDIQATVKYRYLVIRADIRISKSCRSIHVFVYSCRDVLYIVRINAEGCRQGICRQTL